MVQPSGDAYRYGSYVVRKEVPHGVADGLIMLWWIFESLYVLVIHVYQKDLQVRYNH